MAYVDDVDSIKSQLMALFPSLQKVIADITHVLRRYGETVTPHHSSIGEWRGQPRACLCVCIHGCGLCTIPCHPSPPSPTPFIIFFPKPLFLFNFR